MYTMMFPSKPPVAMESSFFSGSQSISSMVQYG